MKLFSRPRRAPQVATHMASEGLLAGRHVLVVDDDDEVRRLLKTVLEMEGARVSQADGAGTALGVAARAGCDVVVTDITMGHTRRDGVHLLERLRSTPGLAKIPVVAVTGCKQLQSDLVAQGFARVLIKPIEVGSLAPMLHALLNADRQIAA